jgi:hypothetical protein
VSLPPPVEKIEGVINATLVVTQETEITGRRQPSGEVEKHQETSYGLDESTPSKGKV